MIKAVVLYGRFFRRECISEEKALRRHQAALSFISMQECFQNGEREKDPDADIENYRHC